MYAIGEDGYMYYCIDKQKKGDVHSTNAACINVSEKTLLRSI